MSQDLLAEFAEFAISGEPIKNTAPTSKLGHAPYGQFDGSLLDYEYETSPATVEEDPDDFGDFETAAQDVPGSRTVIALQNRASTTSLGHGPKKGLYGQDDTRAPRANALGSVQRSIQRHVTRDSNVLFDAEDPCEAWEEVPETNDDDHAGDETFGDFEGVETGHTLSQVPTSTIPTSTASADLLGLDEDHEPAPVQSRKPTPINFHAIASRSTKPKTTASRLVTRPSPPPLPTEDDAWDDFEPLPAPSSPRPRDMTSSPPAAPSTHASVPSPLLKPASSHQLPELPPTTIPPPSVLLSLFPAIITHTNSVFLTPLSALPQEEKHLILTSPATHTFLVSYTTLLTVLARTIAGRRLRWKRSTHLAQSMRIGPAVSGRSGGMKLTGVDKSETAREDAAVQEVVRAWRAEGVGRLRSVIAAFNTAAGAASASDHAGSAGGAGAVPAVPLKPLPPVIDLGDAMPVRVAKASEGAVVSVHACALCGLKREERVGRVEGIVEDSFGEWWAESASMHVACAAFWEKYKERLRER